MPSLLKRYTLSFWFWHLALPLMLGGLLWQIYPATGIDELIEAWYFDPVARNFPLRNEPWLTAGMHTGLKMLTFLIGIAVFGAWITSFFEPILQPEQRRLAWIWISIVLASLLISVLKLSSIHHCPWDIADYGGYAPHLGLFDVLPSDVKPGRCFPGGHASGGFVLLGLYFGLRDVHKRAAYAALAGALLLGFVMGWAQTMRGAHFLSHTLWSAWIIWLVQLFLYLAFPPHFPSRQPILANRWF